MPDSGYVPPYAPGVSTPTGWRLLFSWGGSQSDSVTALMIRDTLAVNVADTTGNRPGPGQGPPGWGDTQNLYRYLGRDATVKGWEGLEHLKAGNVDYLAAFNAYLFDGIHISRLYWNGPNFTLRVPAVTGVDEVGAATAALRMRVLGFHPNAVAVRFEIDSPIALPVKLESFDVAGRRVSSLVDKALAPGRTIVIWNRAEEAPGGRPSSGVYFARLSYASGARVARLPLVR